MKRRILLLATLAWVHLAPADEPIMNMMPRWDGGWGYQVIEEFRYERDLLLGRKKQHAGFSESIHLMHLQGVYTWDKSIRLTAKLPYVLDASREMPDGSGGKLTERDQGIGDLTLALPLKKYFNLDGRSGSYTLKPMLRVPLSGNDDFEVYDNEWGTGLGTAYESETARFHFHVSTSAWVFHGHEPFKSKSSIDLGYNFEARGTNGTFLWESDFIVEDNGTRTFSAGPVLYWNVNDVTHFRLEWKHDFYDRQGELNHGNGDTIRFSLGWVF